MENKDILNALQNYEMTFGTAENIFSGGLLEDAERDFVMRDSNAFLFGLIADQSVKAETAWSLPYKLAQRLGHFSMQKIAKESSSEEIGTLLRTKPALHRYPGNMGRYLWSAAERLTSEYDGCAENIWGNVTAMEIVERLEAFSGISHKKASLACLLLWRDLGVEISDKENIDIAYDVHIRRIFLRAGFCEKDTLKDVTEAARRLNPKFPGYLTSPFWALGRNSAGRRSHCADNVRYDPFAHGVWIKLKISVLEFCTVRKAGESANRFADSGEREHKIKNYGARGYRSFFYIQGFNAF